MRGRVLALALGTVLAAGCSGGNGAVAPPVTAGATVSAATRLVGVGDSLTAGEQSNGLLGTTAANTVSGSPLGPLVPPTQANGFWALLWEQLNGVTPAAMLASATSPLPLIAAPGLIGILVPAANGAPTPIAAPCTASYAQGFSPATALQTRLNPQTSPFDVAIPGQTAHEALYMFGPTSSCQTPTVSGAPNPYYTEFPLVSNESGTILPILGTFGPNVTQVQAAVALRPQLATVWLGNNEVLKFLGAAGSLPPTDPGSLYADLVSIVGQLQTAGAKVVVANLPDVLGGSYFTSQAGLGAIIVAQLTANGVPAASARAVAAQYVAQVQAQGVGAGGYLQLSGLFKTLGAVAAQAPVTLAAADIVPDAFAAQVQALNDQYNVQIKNAAAATGAVLVDLNAAFKQIRTNGGYPVNLPKCCSLLYGGGLTSFDGLHPSNTGYAIIANLFIAALDQGLGMTIAPVNVGTIYATDPFAPQ